MTYIYFYDLFEGLIKDSVPQLYAGRPSLIGIIHHMHQANNLFLQKNLLKHLIFPGTVNVLCKEF